MHKPQKKVLTANFYKKQVKAFDLTNENKMWLTESTERVVMSGDTMHCAACDSPLGPDLALDCMSLEDSLTGTNVALDRDREPVVVHRVVCVVHCSRLVPVRFLLQHNRKSILH